MTYTPPTTEQLFVLGHIARIDAMATHAKFAAATPDMVGRFNAAELAKAAVIAMGGQGAGGKPDFAQGGAPDASKAAAGLEAVKAALAG